MLTAGKVSQRTSEETLLQLGVQLCQQLHSTAGIIVDRLANQTFPSHCEHTANGHPRIFQKKASNRCRKELGHGTHLIPTWQSTFLYIYFHEQKNKLVRDWWDYYDMKWEEHLFLYMLYIVFHLTITPQSFTQMNVVNLRLVFMQRSLREHPNTSPPWQPMQRSVTEHPNTSPPWQQSIQTPLHHDNRCSAVWQSIQTPLHHDNRASKHLSTMTTDAEETSGGLWNKCSILQIWIAEIMNCEEHRCTDV